MRVFYGPGLKYEHITCAHFPLEKLIYVALYIRRLGKVAKAWAKREEEMGLMKTWHKEMLSKETEDEWSVK